MSEGLRSWKPQPGTVLGIVAIVIALGGTAVAAKIGANKVKSKQIKDGQVFSVDLADGGVATVDLAAGSVTTDKLADNAVNSAKIAANGVASADIADNAITNPKLADNAVANAELADNAVSTNEVAADSLTANDLANNSVNTGEIVNGGVTGPDIVPAISAFESGTGANGINLGVGAANLTTVADEGGTNFAGEEGIVIAKASFDNTAAALRDIECRLLAPDGQILDEVDASQGALTATAANDDEVWTLIGFDSLLSGSYQLRCFAFAGAAGDVDAFGGKIVLLPAINGEA